RATTIVFDAAGAPPGLPRTTTHDSITVHFAQRHSDADEMIEDLLEECAAPRSLLVVSSDHRVQRAARHRGASFIDSEQWYTDLVANSRKRRAKGDDGAAKPSGELTTYERKYWIREFSDSTPPGDESDNPFPLGYGDDIAEE